MRVALDFLAGRSCTAISAVQGLASNRGILSDDKAQSTIRREMPGVY